MKNNKELIQVPVPDKFPGHLSPSSPPDEDFNETVKWSISRAQLSDALNALPVACGRCKQEHRFIDLFRCYYCLVWYCRTCGAEHFAQATGKGEDPRQTETQQHLALDISLEKARALHRVWRALNDGDCPNCHSHRPATQMLRPNDGIMCPSCAFTITADEIRVLQHLFAPAMDAAMEIFREWQGNTQEGK